jgi:hypothetical protein
MIANAKDFRIIVRHGDIAVAEKLVGRRGYTVIEMSRNTMVVDLANRTTEQAARAKANEIWKREVRLRTRY